MDPITLTKHTKRSRLLGTKRVLSVKEYSLINQLNVILELIIMNTLEFNKLTSTGEIMEKLTFIYVESINENEFELDIDIDTIEDICQLLCNNNGLLIKLVKNNVNYYKLNTKNYM
jgi:hypothetical protein